jgi:hypothetical protein
MNFKKVCLALSCAAAFSLTACGDDDSSPTGSTLGGGGTKVGSCDFTADDDVWVYSYGMAGEITTVTFTLGEGTSYKQQIKVSVNGAVTTQTIDGDYEDEYDATREEFFEYTMNTCKNLNKATITSSSSKGSKKSSSSKGLVDDEPLDEENYTCKTEGAKRTIEGIPAVCYQGYWMPEEYMDLIDDYGSDDDDDYGSDDDDYDDDDDYYGMTSDEREFLELLESDYYACDEEGATTTLNGVPSVCMGGEWAPQDFIAKYSDVSCTDGAKDTYKFKLPDGTYATIKLLCDEGEWTADSIIMP